MFELPKYIRGRLSFTVEELELLIELICKDCVSIKMADRFIQARLTDYELLYRSNTMNDFEMEDYMDWKDVETYFDSHKLSFERQYFKRKLWV
jgi:hypothetical protein